MKYLLYCGLALILSPGVFAANVSESLTFFKNDGYKFTTYNTTRTSGGGYNLFLPKLSGEDQSQDKALANYLYIFPNNYKWDTQAEKDYNLLRFFQGDHATLTQGTYENTEYVTINDSGVFTYKNWDGKQKTSRGNFGRWTTGGFSQFASVFDFPENFEIISYKSNQNGIWKLRQNTLSFFTSNVNNITFEIKYQLRTQQTFQSIKKALNNVEADIKQASNGVQVTLGSQLLFASGSADLTEEGKRVIGQLASSIKDNEKQIIIEGHTDNVPIRGELTKSFATNWELSSARSLTILHFILKAGVSPKRLQARAFGSQKPVADNNTVEGRAKNRRIEIKLL